MKNNPDHGVHHDPIHNHHSLDHAALTPHHHARPAADKTRLAHSVLAWPAWWRVAAVLPLVLALWLAVLWADVGVTP